MKYYLRIEGINLSNFVYDTQDLSTIRGSGLAILEAVNIFDSKTIDEISLTKISTGASAGMFEFEVPNVSTFDQKAFCQAIRKELNSNGNVFRYATFAIDVLPFTDNLEANFQIDREKILAKNRWQQMQSSRLAVPTFNNSTAQNRFKRFSCDVDKVLKTQKKYRFKNETKEVSKATFYRRKYGFKKKLDFVIEELRSYPISSKIINRFAWDFDDLTFAKKDDYNAKDKANLHHKMAVIYLDGNDFGKEQRSLEIEELQKFDAEKTAFQRNWLARLMEKVVSDEDWHFTQKNEKGKIETLYQLEMLLWGGDEICLVVPAWKGWEVIEDFYQHKLDWNAKTLTHSLGIVFCHHNAPIRRIKSLAESLAGLAKDKSREHNYFAYEILESFDHISKELKTHRESRCPQDASPNAESLILDGNNISKITQAMKEFKQFMPKRKLNQIVQKLLRKDKYAEAKNLIDEVKKELKKDDEIVKLAEVLGDEPMFWTHALALWDFIEEQN